MNSKELVDYIVPQEDCREKLVEGIVAKYCII